MNETNHQQFAPIAPPPPPPETETGNEEHIALIHKAIEELRPVLKRDGGDLELVKIDGDTVIVDLKGTCVGCVLSSVTLAGVRKRIVELVGKPLRVVPRSAFVPLSRMKAMQ